jgi:hypothetical protein
MRIFAIPCIAVLLAFTAVAQEQRRLTPQVNMVVVEGNVNGPGLYYAGPLNRPTPRNIPTQAGGLKVQDPYPVAFIQRLDVHGNRENSPGKENPRNMAAPEPGSRRPA